MPTPSEHQALALRPSSDQQSSVCTLGEGGRAKNLAHIRNTGPSPQALTLRLNSSLVFCTLGVGEEGKTLPTRPAYQTGC